MPAILDPTQYWVGEDGPVLTTGGGSPPEGLDERGGGGDDEDDGYDREPSPSGWVTLAAFWYPAQAHIARLRLEASGVACVLVGEIAAATHLLNIATGGVKLQVPRAQYPRAARLLRGEPRGGQPQSRVALADFERLLDAKAAACVLESAGLQCELVERCHFAGTPAWGRVLPAGLRSRLWPAASVVVERDVLADAVSALLSTPFHHGLTPSAKMARPEERCRACDAPALWARWRLVWPTVANPGRYRLLLPHLARKCGWCGRDWQ